MGIGRRQVAIENHDRSAPGPAIGFGLSVPGFSFGIGTPAVRSYLYGYSQPYGYGGGYGYPRYVSY